MVLADASSRVLAERGGFEPPVRLLTVQRFSKPPPSATRPSLQTIRFAQHVLRANGSSMPLSSVRAISYHDAINRQPNPQTQAHCAHRGLFILTYRSAVNSFLFYPRSRVEYNFQESERIMDMAAMPNAIAEPAPPAWPTRQGGPAPGCHGPRVLVAPPYPVLAFLNTKQGKP